MHFHIAIYKWRDGTPEVAVNEALAEVESLADKVPDIVEICTGKNTSRYAEGFTHVILVKGLNQRAIDAYREHPLHQAVAETIEQMEEAGVGVDFSTSG